MTMPYEEITSLIGEMKQTEDEIERLEQRKKNIGKNIAAAFANHLNPIYRNWRGAGCGCRFPIESAEASYCDSALWRTFAVSRGIDPPAAMDMAQRPGIKPRNQFRG